MNADTIREYCLTFPRTSEKLQWGDALCFKVSGKMFAVLGLDDLRLCFKCTPDMFSELIEREDIRPAPYLARYKWVLLDHLNAVAWKELQDLIRQSYDMVVAKIPKGRKASSSKKSKRPTQKKRGANPRIRKSKRK
jgi:predicted DNA-binding protein (MmcQ/YjbR family)